MVSEDKRETMIMWGVTKEKALLKMEEFKRRGHQINSQDDLLNFFMDNMKTPQEEIRSLLIPLKEHLINLNEEDTYAKIELMLKPIINDPTLLNLIDHYKDVKKEYGEVDDDTFMEMCIKSGIHKGLVSYYKRKVLEELEEVNKWSKYMG